MKPGEKNTIMVHNEIIRSAILFLIGCLLSCCALHRERTQPIFFDSSPNVPVPAPVIETLRKRANKISTIKSSVTMHVKYNALAKTEKLTGFIAIGGPGKVRFKGFTLLGLTLFDLAVRDGQMQLFLPGKDELYQGDLQAVYDSPLALPFLPCDISAIFYPAMYDSPKLQFREIEGYYILSVPDETIANSRRCRYLWIEKKQLLVRKMEIYSQDGLETVCNFDNYQLINENYFPFMIEIVRQPDRSRIRIAVNSIKVNDTIDSNAFYIDAKNVKKINKLGKSK